MRTIGLFVYNRIRERGEIMIERKVLDNMTDSAEATVPAFGYELIREILLPSLLGKDTKTILYWAGKDLARKFPLQSFDEMVDFFVKAGWGSLTTIKETKNEWTMELTSPLISERLSTHNDCTFQLEAGFLAQQIESQKQVITEAYEHPKKRAKKVHFTIKWDRKDPLG